MPSCGVVADPRSGREAAEKRVTDRFRSLCVQLMYGRSPAFPPLEMAAPSPGARVSLFIAPQRLDAGPETRSPRYGAPPGDIGWRG